MQRYKQFLGMAHVRLSRLQEQLASAAIKRDNAVLVGAIDELGRALAQLQGACEELARVKTDAAVMRDRATQERQRFQDFFDFVPAPALITDTDLKILDANQHTAALLNVSVQALRGKSFELFLGGDRIEFCNRLRGANNAFDDEVLLRPRERKAKRVHVKVAPIHLPDGEGLQWLLRPDTSVQQQSARDDAGAPSPQTEVA